MVEELSDVKTVCAARVLVPLLKRGRLGYRPHAFLMSGRLGYICEYVRIAGTIEEPGLIVSDKEHPNAVILAFKEE